MTPGILLVALARVLRVAAEECETIAREASQENAQWLSQAESPLGRRRHINACRRRMESKLDGAGQVGRKFLLSPEAIAEELGSPVETKPSAAESLEQKLRLVGGGL